jgi:hypothetical protein
MDSSTKWRSGPTSPKESSCPPRFQMGSENTGTAREVSGAVQCSVYCCVRVIVHFFILLGAKPSVCIAIVFVDQI